MLVEANQVSAVDGTLRIAGVQPSLQDHVIEYRERNSDLASTQYPVDILHGAAVTVKPAHLVEHPFPGHHGRADADQRFFEQFRRCVGVSPQQYLRWRRMARATQRLSDRGVAVAEVAGELGFTAPGHFSRFFEQHIGFTPREDALGGGAAIAPEMMRTMAELGMSLFLSEYPADENAA